MNRVCKNNQMVSNSFAASVFAVAVAVAVVFAVTAVVTAFIIHIRSESFYFFVVFVGWLDGWQLRNAFAGRPAGLTLYMN